jgi:hypothetical protein
VSENDDDLFPEDGQPGFIHPEVERLMHEHGMPPPGDMELQRDEHVAHYLAMIPAIQAEAGPGGMAQPAGLEIAEPGRLDYEPSYCRRCKQHPPRAGALLQPGGIDDWLSGHAQDCPVRAEWDPAHARRLLASMPDISIGVRHVPGESA